MFKKSLLALTVLALMLFIGGCKESAKQEATNPKTDLEEMGFHGDIEPITEPESDFDSELDIPKTDLEKMGFHGDIESITKSKFNLESKFGVEIIGELVQKSEYKFNPQGNKIEESEYNSKGVLYLKYKYQYDTTGNLIAERCFGLDDGGFIVESYYDSEGELGMEYEYVSQYDSTGNLIEESRYLVEGEYKYIKYQYDSNGNLIEENYRTYKGELISKSKYQYDSHGNLIEERMYSTEIEKPQSITKYEITYRQ